RRLRRLAQPPPRPQQQAPPPRLRRRPPHHREQPRLHAGAPVEARPPVEDLLVHRLQHVLRFRRIAATARQRPGKAPRVPRRELRLQLAVHAAWLPRTASHMTRLSRRRRGVWYAWFDSTPWRTRCDAYTGSASSAERHSAPPPTPPARCRSPATSRTPSTAP